MKKIFARVISEIFYYMGHCISYPMTWFDWSWLYPAYSSLMCASYDIQLWADNELPWEKPNDL